MKYGNNIIITTPKGNVTIKKDNPDYERFFMTYHGSYNITFGLTVNVNNVKSEKEAVRKAYKKLQGKHSSVKNLLDKAGWRVQTEQR